MGASASAKRELPTSYCSWCLFVTAPVIVTESSLGNLYQCQNLGCQRQVQKCVVPYCPNYACWDSIGGMDTGMGLDECITRNDRFCLMHQGILPSFAKAHMSSIESPSDYRSIFLSAPKDYKNLARQTAAAVSGAAFTMAAAAAAPLVGGTVVAAGSAMLASGLTGLLLSKVGQCDIKGLGMLTLGDHDERSHGQPKARSVTAIVGTPASTILAYKFWKEMKVVQDRGFILERQGKRNLPLIITIDGFGHSASSSPHWSRVIDTLFPKHSWYSYHWDARTDWHFSAMQSASTVVTQRGNITSVVTSATGTAVNSLVAVGAAAAASAGLAAIFPFAAASAAFKSSELFRDAMSSCKGAAFLLADCIARLDVEDRGGVILLGHSLGAYCAFRCLRTLAHSAKLETQLMPKAVANPTLPPPYTPEEVVSPLSRKVAMAVLLGGVPRASHPAWPVAASVVRHKLVNCYSLNDRVLHCLPGDRCGRSPVVINSGPAASKLVNIECVEVTGHTNWKSDIMVERIQAVWSPANRASASRRSIPHISSSSRTDVAETANMTQPDPSWLQDLRSSTHLLPVLPKSRSHSQIVDDTERPPPLPPR
ncbi:hypothetical protein DFS34DRAFT_158849 [Phlyctochytrium arcticum]|nr:hypothetical protein DFS34DRAFT_158849 [Phlyctochytrium arcticum]